ncbi:hypothetical protein CAPTEDRAFT_167139 [Capitella teleta]|uniref:Innexin n=1 Tax=Capitella teleta TaxID=283909 RepID=R7VAX0_CAPTE|nr:hypothetical protein CAPTEDRAFT_167139 [Capitella teleta]|eukprot:ELU12855.1 hypothetical protein CAPTEDRAFT_167139 [Capitella teleta]
MDKLVSLVVKVPKKLRYDDDANDRLHHRYTSVILVVFAVLVTMQQYVGKPITCWVPKEFTGSHTKFTNSLCWVNNTYWRAFEEEIPHAHESHLRKEIIYYQWMPFVLLLQAFFFYVPCLVWRTFNSKAGVDSDNILETAGTFQKTMKMASREKTLRLLTMQIDRFLCAPRIRYGWRMSIQDAMRSALCCVCGKRNGNYLLLLYIFVKVLFIGNVLGQLFILNALLRTNYNLFGVEVVKNALDERAWLNSTVFPKVTMCDFHIRRLGNLHRYTVQCLLPINLYTERIYMFLWFWFVLVLLVSFLNLFSWLYRGFFKFSRKGYVDKYLDLRDDSDRSALGVFVDGYLKLDGVFLLRLIGHNTDGVTASEITNSLWNHWREKMAKKNDATLPLLKNGPNGLTSTPAKRPAPPPPPKPFIPPTSPYIPTTDSDPLNELDMGKAPSAPAYDLTSTP